MNDNRKSLIFVVVAAALAVAAWATHPYLGGFDGQPSELPKTLFPEFTDAAQAASLQIIRFDEQLGQRRDFEVALSGNRWVIPSHANYPADAKDHLAEAATSLLDLKVLGVVSQDPGDQPLYGVVDPTAAKVSVGSVGVGTKVTVGDKNRQPLASLIVGKEAAEKGQQELGPAKNEPRDLRYVRVAGQDPIYVIRLNPEKFSDKFGDWIEKDLLKCNPWDVKSVEINDYTFDVAKEMFTQQGLQQRAQMLLEHNDAGEPKWKLAEDLAAQGGKLRKQTMAADEELNAAKLDDMRQALGDLKIVDVRRKPEGVSARLRREGLVASQAVAQSLMQKGFYLVQVDEQNGQPVFDLYSNEGELRVGMKDGVRYVLRFGGIAADTGDSGKKDAKPDAKGDPKKDAAKDAPQGANRYLFVMAEFDADALEKPKLEELPPEPKAEQAKDAPADKDAKPSAAKPEAAKDTKPTATKDAKAEAKEDQPKPDLTAERQRIERENKQKQEEYQQKVKAGQKRAKELNARFADWYYVIADDVYRKIHLSRADIVQKKQPPPAAKEAGDGHDHAKPEMGAAKPAEDAKPQAAPAESPKDAKPQATPAEPPKDAKPQAAQPEAAKDAKPQAAPAESPKDAKLQAAPTEPIKEEPAAKE